MWHRPIVMIDSTVRSLDLVHYMNHAVVTSDLILGDVTSFIQFVSHIFSGAVGEQQQILNNVREEHRTNSGNLSGRTTHPPIQT